MRVALALAAGAVLAAPAAAADKENRVFEMRVYYANEGKLDALHARFRDHTLKLFERHGMTNVGYWVPVDNPDRRLIYVIAHKDMAARDASFKAFGADPEWQAAAKESEKNGKLVARIEAIFLKATDYSPPIQPAAKGDRVFELRTYVATPNNLPGLNARFQNHTMKLFETHGMTNVAYWNLAPGAKTTVGQLLTALSPAGGATADADPKAPAAPVGLVYLLAHKSPEAAKASFDAFRTDPAWVAARKASEEKAGGSLTVKDGVKSLFLKPTDYSPWK
jgi:hypothetical protein